MSDEGGLVALAPDRLGGEVGSVGLHQQPLLGHPPGCVGEIGGALVGDVAGEGDPVAAIEALLQVLGHREAVHHHLHPLGFGLELGERRLGGGPRVDHERLARLPGERDLGGERALLVGPRGRRRGEGPSLT